MVILLVVLEIQQSKYGTVDGNVRRTLSGHTDWVFALVILPNDYIVSASGDKTIRIWDPIDGSVRRILRGHTKRVVSLALLPNGDIVSGSDDKLIKIWTRA
jgi:phospholipase A-2-activating protein